MKKLTMMFALSMAVTVLASGGAVRWIDGEKIVVDGDKYAMNWILECDGKQYDFLEPRFKWGTFHHPKELAGKIEDSFSRRQDGDDLVETLLRMETDVKSAVAEIESTTDLLERMADPLDSRVIRMTWDEWRASRAAKRAALAEKGLSAPSRRTTARPEARAALRALEDDLAWIR